MKKIRINRTEFIRVLSEGGVFAGRNRAISALNNVRITTNKCRIRVESSSDNNYIKVYGVCLEGTEDMNFCVSHKELITYLNLVEDPELTLTYDEEKSMLRIKHSHGTTKSPTFSPDDFPVISVSGDMETVALPAQTLATWLSTAQQFVMQQNIGTSLGGVNLRAEENMLTVVGADSGLIYLSRCQATLNKDFSVIIPKEGAKVMASMCLNTSQVDLSVMDNVAVIKNEDFALYIKLIDASYPNLNSLAKHKGSSRFEVDANELSRATRRVAAQTDSLERRITVTMQNDMITLCYDFPQKGKHVEENITCQGANLETSAIVSIDYLLLVLQTNVDDKLVFYRDDNERSPFYFESASTDFDSVFLLGTMV